MSVCLLYMPFGALQHPSLAVGLLSAGLRKNGIETKALYANLLFADRVGVEDYRLVNETTRSEVLLGEWVFSQAAFGEHDKDYLQWLSSVYDPARFESVFAAAQRLREAAEPFVNNLAQTIVNMGPRILGASSSFLQNCASLAVLRAVKKLDPSIVTIMGGANCEGAMGLALVRNFPWLDYAFSGEADRHFPEFCREVLGGEKVSARQGLLTKKSPVTRATVNSFEDLPIPSYDDYFQTLSEVDFGSTVDPGLVMETSRGCWWGAKHHCTFCGLNGGGMGYRAKPAEQVLREFATLNERYGVSRFEIADNILDMKHLRSVLPELARLGAPYNVFYETKSNLRQDHVKLLADAGVRWIQPGIESLHDKVLKLMNKGSTALLNVQLLRNAREFGVRISWNFLSGFPGEESAWSQEMAEWLPKIVHLQPPSGNARVRYDRFSPYHMEPDHYGISLKPFPAYALVYPLPHQELLELAYFFDDEDPRLRQLKEPGYRDLRRRIDDWQERWAVIPPMLALSDEQVYDTRKGSRCIQVGEEAQELLAKCSTPQIVSGSLADELQRDGMLLTLDGKSLSLVVNGDVPSLPTLEDFPGGHLRARPWNRRYKGLAVQV
jgi:ribosomal peptide maturation radical SAM protein 1